jgi:hypothetical protein
MVAMLRPWIGAAFLLACSVDAQSPLVTHYNGNSFLVSLDGGVYFDLTVHTALQLDALDLNLYSPYGTTGTLEVFVRPGTWIGHVEGGVDWVRAASGNVTALGQQQASPCTLSTAIGLPPGTYGIALHLQGVMPIYSTAFGLRSFANNDLTLTAGSSALQFLSSAPYLYRVFSGALHYTPGGGPYEVATVASYGEGCIQGARSFYELFSAGTFDLANQRFVLTPNAVGGYDVTRTASVPIVLPPGATNLNLQRGGVAFVTLPATLSFPGGTTPSLLAASDGRVMLTDLGLLGSATTVPSATALLERLPTVAVAWMDLAPSGANNVYSYFDAASGSTSVLWWNMPAFGAPATSNTFAFTTHPNGTLELNINNASNASASSLVGFGAGSQARDPGSRDLSSSAPFSTQVDNPGLRLAAEGRPVIGTTTTLRPLHAPAQSIATMLLLAWQPLVTGIDLGPLGAPDCRYYLDLASTMAFVLGNSQSLTLSLPSNSNLLGLPIYSQAAALVPAGNALGAVTSNALTLTIGGV